MGAEMPTELEGWGVGLCISRPPLPSRKNESDFVSPGEEKQSVRGEGRGVRDEGRGGGLPGDLSIPASLSAEQVPFQSP